MGDIVFRGVPVQWAHGEGVILSVMYGKLCGKVLKRIKFVGGIKVFVIFAV